MRDVHDLSFVISNRLKRDLMNTSPYLFVECVAHGVFAILVCMHLLLTADHVNQRQRHATMSEWCQSQQCVDGLHVTIHTCLRTHLIVQVHVQGSVEGLNRLQFVSRF